MSTSIPTTAAITEAKERRERMRAEGGGTGTDSFISLEVGRVVKSGESRLVREEDELGDGDEGKFILIDKGPRLIHDDCPDAAEFTGALETVPLGRKANKLAADRMKAGMVEMIEDAEGEEGESDEEAREWEEAQIRRGEQRRVQEVVSSRRSSFCDIAEVACLLATDQKSISSCSK
jgi:GC-rich sequence DNA-binding factor